MRKDKRLPRRVGIEFDEGLTEQVTARGGISLLIETGRQSGVVCMANHVLPAKKNPKGLGPAQMIESFVDLSGLGGECLDDLAMLRVDEGLAAMVGYELPAPSTARGWLELYHDEKLMAEKPSEGSFIPRESVRLVGLGMLVRRSVQAYVAAAKPGREVTLDVDAHLLESSKREALPTYAGFRGYQPLLVTWAETDLVLADQLRDGNVPAGKGIRELVD